jgi:C4-dicarboxylate-specific signal transduction histidine kinase
VLTEQKLQEAHDKLEQRVKERTAELKQTYKQLLHMEKLSAIGISCSRVWQSHLRYSECPQWPHYKFIIG